MLPSASLKQIESAAQSWWLNRNPNEPAINLFDKKGMQLYAQLLKNGRQGVLESIFPLSQKVLGEEWERVTEAYIAAFPPAHFNLNRLAERFAFYLAQHEATLSQQESLLAQYEVQPAQPEVPLTQHEFALPRFLPELADYEWLELEVMEHPAQVSDLRKPAPSSLDDFMTLSPTVNPTISVRRYNFDVQRIVDHLNLNDDVDLAQCFGPAIIAAFRPPDCHYCRLLELSQLETGILEAAMKDNILAGSSIKYSDLAKLAISLCTGAAPEETSLKFINTAERFHEVGIFL